MLILTYWHSFLFFQATIKFENYTRLLATLNEIFAVLDLLSYFLIFKLHWFNLKHTYIFVSIIEWCLLLTLTLTCWLTTCSYIYNVETCLNCGFQNWTVTLPDVDLDSLIYILNMADSDLDLLSNCYAAVSETFFSRFLSDLYKSWIWPCMSVI